MWRALVYAGQRAKVGFTFHPCALFIDRSYCRGVTADSPEKSRSDEVPSLRNERVTSVWCKDKEVSHLDEKKGNNRKMVRFNGAKVFTGNKRMDFFHEEKHKHVKYTDISHISS